MEKPIDALKALVDSGEFHHATYRNQGTLWEGLWFYKRSEAGFRGYEIVGCILKDDPDLEDGWRLVKGTGVSLGCFGEG